MKKAFTIIEIIITMIVITAVSAVVLTNVSRGRKDNNTRLAWSRLMTISTALEAAHNRNGTYPTALTDLIYIPSPNVNRNYCGITIDGYTYDCDLSTSDYSITATETGLEPTKITVNSGANFSFSIYKDGEILAIAPACIPYVPPAGGGSSCFLSGTPITMANGSTKAIEQLKVGDTVLAYDEATGSLKPDKVKEFFEHEADEYLVVNGRLKLTDNHPVNSGGKWVEIGKLKKGDSLLNAQGKEEKIASIEKVIQKVKVYNLEVNPYHTYIAGGIVVHNKGELPPGED